MATSRETRQYGKLSFICDKFFFIENYCFVFYAYFLKSNRNALPRILALTKAQDEKVCCTSKAQIFWTDVELCSSCLFDSFSYFNTGKICHAMDPQPENPSQIISDWDSRNAIIKKK